MIRLTLNELKAVVRESVKQILSETEWNFHYGKNHNGQPYFSDNKYNMRGRDTGHFGSGTYFSTFSDKINNNPNELYVNSNSTPEFVQVGNGIYRVDMSFYKNLYRIKTTKQGYVLFTLLKFLNNIYNNVTYKDFNNSQLYQKAERNASALNLKMPPYRDLMRMMLNHHQSNNMQSFSTVYMEYNGYNGVNVSNIPEFDNTLHGSVIYDLSKVEKNVEQINPKSLWSNYGNGTNMVIPNQNKYGETEDVEIESMYKELNGSKIVEILNSLPKHKAMRILKNNVMNNRLISPYYLEQLNDDIASHFLYYMYSKQNQYRDLIQLYWFRSFKEKERLYKIIEKLQAYYWINFNDFIMEDLIQQYEWDLPYDLSKEEQEQKTQEYIKKLEKFKRN